MHWDKSPLRNLFDETVFSYKAGYLKPRPEIYELALKRMNVNAERCIFVGDGGSDELKGEKALGIKTILSGYLLEREESQHNVIRGFADYYVEEFAEVKDYLIYLANSSGCHSYFIGSKRVKHVEENMEIIEELLKV